MGVNFPTGLQGSPNDQNMIYDYGPATSISNQNT